MPIVSTIGRRAAGPDPCLLSTLSASPMRRLPAPSRWWPAGCRVVSALAVSGDRSIPCAPITMRGRFRCPSSMALGATLRRMTRAATWLSCTPIFFTVAASPAHHSGSPPPVSSPICWAFPMPCRIAVVRWRMAHRHRVGVWRPSGQSRRRASADRAGCRYCRCRPMPPRHLSPMSFAASRPCRGPIAMLRARCWATCIGLSLATGEKRSSR